ncbi:MAG: hypothetical protein JNM18_02260 [Planctomycetaceae bacterium]|nr:hypothetical protein [Planctomycetaceae bacterium]
MDHVDHVQADAQLARVRHTIIDRDPLVEWSLVALIAGVNAVVYRAPSAQPKPLVGLLRGALFGQQEPIEFDRHLLQGVVTLPASDDVDEPAVIVTGQPLDALATLKLPTLAQPLTLGVSIDAREQPANGPAESDLVRGDLFASAERLMWSPGYIAYWRQQAQALSLSPEQGEYALHMIRAAQPHDAQAASHTRAYVTTGPENAALRDLLRVARAWAYVRGHDRVRDRDVKGAALRVLRHRLVRNSQAWNAKFELHDLTRAIIDGVPRPAKAHRRDSDAILPPSAPLPSLPPREEPPGAPSTGAPNMTPMPATPSTPYVAPQELAPVEWQPPANASPYASAYQDPYYHGGYAQQPPGAPLGYADPYAQPAYAATAAPAPSYEQPASLPAPRRRRSGGPSFISLLLAYIIGGAAGLWIGSKVLVYVRDELGWRWTINWLQPRDLEKQPMKSND